MHSEVSKKYELEDSSDLDTCEVESVVLVVVGDLDDSERVDSVTRLSDVLNAKSLLICCLV